MEIEKLEITQNLPVLSCDYDSLEKWAIAMTDKYSGLVITEDQIADIKKDMAELNKAKSKLDRARIDAVKAVSAPIREFEARIKSICGLFDKTYGELNEQVRQFDIARREEKRKTIQNTIKTKIACALIGNPDMEDKISISVNDKWLNKTVSLKQVADEIDGLIDEQIAANRAIMQEEKAKAERRLFIERTVAAVNEKYKVNIPVSHWMVAPYTELDMDALILEASIEAMGQTLSEEKAAVAPENQKAYVELAPVQNAQGKGNPGAPGAYKATGKMVPHSLITESLAQYADPTIPFEEALRFNHYPPQDNIPFSVKGPHIDIRNEDAFAHTNRCWQMTFYYNEAQSETIRQIFQDCQFMRIVRMLNGIGIEAKIEKLDV